MIFLDLFFFSSLYHFYLDLRIIAFKKYTGIKSTYKHLRKFFKGKKIRIIYSTKKHTFIIKPLILHEERKANIQIQVNTSITLITLH